jgi:steroid 5-alpha reductase family enzyme
MRSRADIVVPRRATSDDNDALDASAHTERLQKGGDEEEKRANTLIKIEASLMETSAELIKFFFLQQLFCYFSSPPSRLNVSLHSAGLIDSAKAVHCAIWLFAFVRNSSLSLSAGSNAVLRVFN